MKWLWCWLFHKKWRARMCLDDPAECAAKGKFNRVVERRYCPKCNHLF